MNRFISAALLALLAGASLASVAHAVPPPPTPSKAKMNRLFELRTYTTHPGRLDALHARFRDHTNRLFVKHGMELVGYWTPQDGEGDTLIYILAFPNSEARDKAWKGFRNDPEWMKAKEASEKDGPIVKTVESRLLSPTDYSPIK